MFIRKSKRLPHIVIAALLLTMTAWLLPGELTVEKAEAAVTLKDPVIVKDSSMESGQKVTWDCIYFGIYPQREVIADEASYDAIFRGNDSETGYYNKDTDVIEDAALFSKLENATGWDSNGDITIDGSKYRRMKKSDATYGTSESDYYYNWKDATLYHYFKYEPIKWRVLDVNGTDAFLLADRALDDQPYLDDHPYNKEWVSVTWEKSTMRSWLNGYGSSENTSGTDYTGSNFINSAFTSSQRNAVKTTDVVNKDNISYGTEGGNDTKDKVFLLSESEVYNTTEAKSYGFLKARGTFDEGRGSRSSTYAKAMGVYTSIGNCFWWLRSPGKYTYYAANVGLNGYVDHNGDGVGNLSNAVRPALHLDISSSDLWSYAGTVCSYVAVDNITLDKSSLTLKKGLSERLSATILPSDATNKDVIWTSDNENVATVSTYGTVTAVSEGTANITATTVDVGLSAHCRVAVYIAVDNITLNQSSLTLEKGTSEKLSAMISPSDATNKEVTWTSKNEDVAMVSSNGCVTAVSEGTAIIMATAVDGGKVARCRIKVIDSTYKPAVKLKKPSIAKDPSMESGQKVTWDCIYFGSYPQREVIASEKKYDAIYKGDYYGIGYYNKDTDVIVDAALFSNLENATNWNSSGDNNLNGSKYRRMKKQDATNANSGDINSYNWKDSSSYHYFKYEPIKWRVLDVTGRDVLLLADKALDNQKYSGSDTTWEKSALRNWLNGYGSSENTRRNFIKSAFTSSQISDVKTTYVENKDNINYGTSGGNDTQDKVFLLSESEVYGTADSESYGFIKGISNDESRMSQSSTYAKAMGTWNDSSTYAGNCHWGLRSPGYFAELIAYIDSNGYVSCRGCDGDSEGGYEYIDYYGIRPSVNLDISSSDSWSYAGTVCSDGTVSSKTSIDLGKCKATLSSTKYTYNGKTKKPSVTVSYENSKIKKGTDYTVAYTGSCKAVGKYKVVVKGTGDFKGTKTLYFTINPKSTSLSTLTAAKKGFTAKWKKQSTQASGYQIMYATNSKFTSGKKTVTVSSNKTTSKKITKLKAKKKYYVKVRTYKKVGSTKYHSSWSKVKTVKTK